MTSEYRCIAFSMVKNEVDIIEPFVRHNLQFLDAMIVFDHYSTDGTREVLLKLAHEFGNLAIGTFDGNALDQGLLMTRQVSKFQQRFHADFVTFLDADEFLDFDSGVDLIDCASGIPSGGVGLIPWRTHLPDVNAAAATVEPLDRFTLRRRQEKPVRYKVILRLDGGGADQFRVGQGSHTVRTRSGGKVAEKILGGIRLMHFPVRSIDQLVAKSMIGSLTNGLRSARKAKTQATQWQRVADMERKGEMRDGAQFLFEEAMRYAQSPHGGNLNHNAEPSVHGINTLRRYSDGSRPSANTLYQAEVSRIGPDTSRKENWFEKALAWVKGNDDAEDLQALQYLFRKYGRSGVYLDLDFGRLSGFSTASRADCGVYVRLTDALPGPHFVKAQFDTSVAQALSGTDRLRKCLGVFVRDTVVPGKVD